MRGKYLLLRNLLFFIGKNEKYLNSEKSLSSSLGVIILLLFLCSSFINAQQTENHSDTENVTVFLTNGASLYSTDEAFNNSVNINKGVSNNAEIAQQGNNTRKALDVSSRKEVIKKDFNHELKNAVNAKQTDEFKKVKQEIENHNERKESFPQIAFNDLASTSQFFSANSVSKNYIAPNHNGNDSFKLYVSNRDYFIKRALNYLHAIQFIYYNNKSLDYCFSQVFSVRPPPVLA